MDSGILMIQDSILVCSPDPRIPHTADQAGEKPKLRALFDSGCGATLVNKRFVRHWNKTESKATKWSTKGGSFKTKRKCEI
jgi:hypothetical protein